jgi:hypothetical protein
VRVMQLLDGKYCIIDSSTQKLMVDSSRHLLHRDTLSAASAIYKGMVKRSDRVALTTRTSRAPWTRGRHGASYVSGHLPSQLSFFIVQPYVLTHSATVDWVEACAPATEAIGEGLGRNKS